MSRTPPATNTIGDALLTGHDPDAAVDGLHVALSPSSGFIPILVAAISPGGENPRFANREFDSTRVARSRSAIAGLSIEPHGGFIPWGIDPSQTLYIGDPKLGHSS